MNRRQVLIFINFEMLKKALKAYKMFLYGGRNMQTKKESIREEILRAAQKEFLLHGYEAASMRVIAKKANTTLGNIYHYFPNKEAILSEILEEPLEKLSKLVEDHLELQVKAYTMDEMLNAIKEMDDLSSYKEFQYMLDERLLILFELRTTRFIEVREAFVKKFKNHMAWHLGMEDSDSPYIDILTSTFISCIRHVLLEHKDAEDAQKEFIKVFKMLCTGLVVNEQKL